MEITLNYKLGPSQVALKDIQMPAVNAYVFHFVFCLRRLYVVREPQIKMNRTTGTVSTGSIVLGLCGRLGGL